MIFWLEEFPELRASDWGVKIVAVPLPPLLTLRPETGPNITNSEGRILPRSEGDTVDVVNR